MKSLIRKLLLSPLNFPLCRWHSARKRLLRSHFFRATHSQNRSNVVPVRRQEGLPAVLGAALVAVVAGVRLLVRAEVAGRGVGAAAVGVVAEELLGRPEQRRAFAGGGGGWRRRRRASREARLKVRGAFEEGRQLQQVSLNFHRDSGARLVPVLCQ